MNLVLTTFGTYLHREGEMFLVNVKDQKQEVSSRKVRVGWVSLRSTHPTGYGLVRLGLVW